MAIMGQFMRTMQLQAINTVEPGSKPLVPVEQPMPDCGAGEVLVAVQACGVCHTELDEIEGRTPPPQLPVTPGHQVIGSVVSVGANCQRFNVGDRVGVGWIGGACGRCAFCRAEQENLCANFIATGRDIHGGYADYMVIGEQFAHPIPSAIDTLQAAPMLCAGAIGYRSLQIAGLQNGQALGLTGFGGSAHLVLQLARSLLPESPVFVFARGENTQRFARECGADWVGDTAASAPQPMAAVIDTTPAWKPLVSALLQLQPGGRLVVNAIRKEEADKNELLRLEYHSHLWMEKEIKSVANVTRHDIARFLALAADTGIRPEVQVYSLQDANEALVALKHQPVRGAKVLDLKIT